MNLQLDVIKLILSYFDVKTIFSKLQKLYKSFYISANSIDFITFLCKRQNNNIEKYFYNKPLIDYGDKIIKLFLFYEKDQHRFMIDHLYPSLERSLTSNQTDIINDMFIYFKKLTSIVMYKRSDLTIIFKLIALLYTNHYKRKILIIYEGTHNFLANENYISCEKDDFINIDIKHIDFIIIYGYINILTEEFKTKLLNFKGNIIEEIHKRTYKTDSFRAYLLKKEIYTENDLYIIHD